MHRLVSLIRVSIFTFATLTLPLRAAIMSAQVGADFLGAGCLFNPPTVFFNPNLFFQPSKTLFQPWVGKNVTPTKTTHGPYIPTFFFTLETYFFHP